MSPRLSISPLRDVGTYPPLGMRREAAAQYLGLSASKFDEMVKDGRMPQPKRIDGCVVWDRRELELAFQVLPIRDAENSWEGV
jgi:predicted DNA-binding transcriptional regulator AlpA